MKKIAIALIILFISLSCKAGCSTHKSTTDTIPAFLLGNFTDDYKIEYTVTDSLWTQHKGINYHILEWNTKEQYIIAQNDNNNPSEKGLYTRIDYMVFENMAPFLWGFCLTVYDAKTKEEAVTKAKSDRQNPKKGCGGYPFSRMKRVE